MFFRRFAAPLSKSVAQQAQVCPATAAAATLTSSFMFQSSSSQSRFNDGGNRSNNNRNRDNQRNYNSNDGNRSNNSNSSSSSSASSAAPSSSSSSAATTTRPQIEYRGSARWTTYTRSSDAFLQLTHAADKAGSGEGYRLLVTFPQPDCTYMDIQYAAQVQDKNAAADDTAAAAAAAEPKSGNDRNRRGPVLFGLPVSQLSVRVYPLQMAKIVAVLEGKANETVIASRLAIGTLKKGPDGGFVYTVQTRVTKPSDVAAPSSIEMVLMPTHAYMMEKFFGKMLVAGFDPSRDPLNTSSGNSNSTPRETRNNNNRRQ